MRGARLGQQGWGRGAAAAQLYIGNAGQALGLQDRQVRTLDRVPRVQLRRGRVRDEPQRPLDYASLTSLSDVFYPRIWLRRATHVPAGTVSMTIYFHASKGQLLESGTGFLLAQAQAQAFRNGFFDQTAQLWSEAGTLLVSSTQLVYFKN